MRRAPAVGTFPAVRTRALFAAALATATLLPAGLALGSGSVPVDSSLVATGPAGSLAGTSVAQAGDVNRDGRHDLIIGDPGFDILGKDNVGAAWVVFGPVTAADVLALPALPAGRGFQIRADSASTGLGNRVAAAGDVNGDGFDDVIVGTTRGPENVIRPAGVVAFGGPSPSSLVVSTSATLPAGRGFLVRPLAGNVFSDPVNVAGVGDVNGDGLDDVAVSTVSTVMGGGSCSTGDAPRDCRGTTAIAFGKAGGVVVDAETPAFGDQGFLVHGPEKSRRAGMGLSAVGDLDGDGRHEFAVGGWGNFISGHPGNVWVVRGKATTGTVNLPTAAATATVPYVLTGQNDLFRIGEALAPAGDVNGDGRPDLIVGAPNANLNNNIHVEGIAAVAFLPAGQRTETFDPLGFNGFAIRTSADATENLGWAVARAGDVDGDGRADVAVGAPGTLGNVGHVHVVLGSTSTQAVTVQNPGTRGYTLTGLAGGPSRTGAALGGGRDLNGDGRPDLVVGAPSLPFQRGSAYVSVTTPLPLVQAGTVTNLTSRSATPRALVTPSLLTAAARVEYGPAGTFGSSAGPTNVPLGAATPVSFGLTGLQPSTTYSFRFVATSTHGTSRGPARTFTTPADPVAPPAPPPPTGTPPPTVTPPADLRAPQARIRPPACRLKPASRCGQLLLTPRPWRVLRGTVSDPAPSSGIARVQVNLVQTITPRRCRALVGRRLAARPCAKARTIFVKARLDAAARTWTLPLPALGPGVYRVRARAIDTAGNVQRVFPPASRRTITIRG
jgi:hypothetical protein